MNRYICLGIFRVKYSMKESQKEDEKGIGVNTPEQHSQRVFWGMADGSVSPTRSVYNKKDKIIRSAKISSKQGSRVSGLVMA